LRELLRQAARRRPVRRFPLADGVAFVVAPHDLDQEEPARLEHATDFPGDPGDVERVIEAVGVDAVDRAVRELKRVEVAGDHETVVRAGIQVDPDGEMPEPDERLHLYAEPGAEAKNGPRRVELGNEREAGP